MYHKVIKCHENPLRYSRVVTADRRIDRQPCLQILVAKSPVNKWMTVLLIISEYLSGPPRVRLDWLRRLMVFLDHWSFPIQTVHNNPHSIRCYVTPAADTTFLYNTQGVIY
jgi:hypothetical protein